MLKLIVILAGALALSAISADAQKAPGSFPIAAGIRQVPPFCYICRPCAGPYTNFAEEEAAFLSDFKETGIKATNVEMAVYWNSPLYNKPSALRWDIGFPVNEGEKARGKLVLRRFNYAKVAAAVHRGPYSTTFRTVNALYGWIFARGLKTIGGPCVEHYLDPEPDKVPDAQKQTAIWIPVQ